MPKGNLSNENVCPLLGSIKRLAKYHCDHHKFSIGSLYIVEAGGEGGREI